MLTKIAAAASAAAMLVVLPAGAAHADPQKADVISVDCENGQSYTVRVFSNGHWSPALLVDGNGVLRPVALDVTGTFVPSDGGETQTFTETSAKNIGAKTRTTTCDFFETGSDEFGTFTFEGTVTIVVP